MSKQPDSRLQIHSAILISYGFPILLLLSIFLCSRLFNIRTYEFVADPMEIANLPAYTGLVSSIGMLFWAAASSICFFTSLVLKKSSSLDEVSASKKWSNFFLYSGLFSLQLLLDDLFQLHESLTPLLTSLFGLSKNSPYAHAAEIITFVIYLGLLFLYLKSFRRLIMRETNIMILGASIVFFVASVILDVGADFWGDQALIEDGFKLLGIFSWMLFLSEAAYHKIMFALFNK